MKRYLILLFVLVMAFSACSNNRTRVPQNPDDKLAYADSLFAAKKYSRAAILYDQISFERRSASSSHALLRLADSYLAINRFADARLRYEQFTTTYPEHPELATAYYKIGVCYYEESLPAQYDQVLTQNSITAFRNFLRRYPSDSRYQDALSYIRKAQYKLIEKKYRNGYIYYMMKDYSAALMYFDEVIALGNTDEIDRLSLYYSTKLHLAQNNQEKALASYNRLREKYPESKEYRRLRRNFD